MSNNPDRFDKASVSAFEKATTEMRQHQAKLADAVYEAQRIEAMGGVTTEEALASTGIDLNEAVQAIRSSRKKIGEVSRDIKSKIIQQRSIAEKTTLRALDDVYSTITQGFRDSKVWGQYATSLEKLDNVAANWYEATRKGGSLETNFLGKQVSSKGTKYVSHPEKFRKFIQNIGKTQATAVEVTDKAVKTSTSAQEALSNFHNSFDDLVNVVDEISPDIRKYRIRPEAGDIKDLAADWRENFESTLNQGILTNAFEEAVAQQMPITIINQDQVENNLVDKLARKVPVVRAIQNAQSFMQAIPEYQLQIEPRLRDIVAARKLAKISDDVTRESVRAVNKTLFGPTSSAIAKAATYRSNIGSAVGLSNKPVVSEEKAFQKEMTQKQQEEESQKETEKYIQEVRQARKLATDSNALFEHIKKQSDLVGGSIPGAVSALTAWTMKAAEEIAKASPNVPDEDYAGWGHLASQPDYKPTPQEIEKHKIVVAATTGEQLVDRLVKGRLTALEVKIAEKTVPGLVGKIRTQLQYDLNSAIERGEFVQPAYRAGLEALLGTPIDEASKPTSSVTAQAIYGKVKAGNSERENTQRPMFRGKKSQMPGQLLTPQQRAEQR
jgi:hypothetical protein